MYILKRVALHPVSGGLLFGILHLGFWWLYSHTSQGVSVKRVSIQTFISTMIVLFFSVWVIAEWDEERPPEERCQDGHPLRRAWRYFAGLILSNIPVALAYLAGC